VDVRIVAATNRDLEDDVRSGRFRSDLFYRLRVAELRIPPLRERRDDILPLARHFLDRNTARYKKVVRFSPATEKILQAYQWPGNVRELENLIQGLVISSEKETIEPCDLPGAMLGEPAITCHETALQAVAKEASCNADHSGPAIDFYRVLGGEGRSLKEMVSDIECAILRDAIQAYGSVSEAAKQLRVDRSTLFRKLRCCRREPRPTTRALPAPAD
jgi:DNA-binding NtrC family response regulator